MKKIFIILLLMTIFLFSCGKQDNNQKLNLQENKKTGHNSFLESQKNILNLQRKLFIESENSLQKNKPQVVEQYKEYEKILIKISKELNTSLQDAEKVIFKYGSYILKYEEIKKNIQKKPTNLALKQKLSRYEQFLEKNLKKENINIPIEKIETILTLKNIKTLNILRNQVSEYILPDGTLVDKNLKQSFEEFKENIGIGDDFVALEEFKKVIFIEQSIIEGKCKLIKNEIDRAYCENMKKSLPN